MLPRYRTETGNQEIICKKRTTKKTKTPEQYKQELKEKCIDVIPLEDYVTAKVKIKHKFPCGHINKVTPDSILRGSKCLQCKNINLGKNKRKSHEHFISELAIINNNIKVLGSYNTANTRIEVECIVCQHVWNPIASSLLMGFGCPKCANHYTMTHEEFIDRVKYNINANLELLGKYVDSHTPIKCMCKKCGNIFSAMPYQIEKGSGCKKCADKVRGYNLRNSHEDFIEKMSEINKSIHILGKYKTAKDYINVQCNKCKYVWNPTADSLLHGYGCPRCANKLVTENEFLKKFNIYGDKNIIICGKYVNSYTKIDCYCIICGYKMKMYSYQLTNGVGCKKCKDKISGQKRKITNDQFINRVKLVNPDLIVLDVYSGSTNKVHVKCSKCGYVWEPTAYVIMKNNPTNCPYCQISKLEKGVKDYLVTNNIKYKQYHKYKKLNGVGAKPLSYDFYLPTYNLLIECQGIQHERPIDFFGGNKQFVTQKIHDIRKRKYAHDNNIRFLEIWYYEKTKINKILEQTLNNLKSESLTTAG